MWKICNYEGNKIDISPEIADILGYFLLITTN